MFQILVVEDDRSTARLMQAVLRHGGYEVVEAGNGIEAMAVMDTQHIDLIVLDVMMPKMDGYEFTERLRSCGSMVPILMVTAKQLPEEKCKGFLVGTDDYMVKPVNQEELLLRIKALLRRAQIASERKLHIGKVTLDYDALTVTRDGCAQTLPKKEFYLLFKLLSYPDKIFTRLQLMDEIWGMESTTVDTTVNTHIKQYFQLILIPLVRVRIGEVNKCHTRLPHIPLPYLTVRSLNKVALFHTFIEKYGFLTDVAVDPDADVQSLCLNSLKESCRIREYTVIPYEITPMEFLHPEAVEMEGSKRNSTI